MITGNKRQPLTGLILASCIFSAVQLIYFLSPAIDLWNEQIADRILSFKTASRSFRPEYTETVAIVDLNNSSMRQLGNYHFDRADYAKAIQNLGEMGVTLQMIDIVFAGSRNENADRRLLEAAESAKNVVSGMVFRLVPGVESKNENASDPVSKAYLSQSKWRDVRTEALPGLYFGTEPIISLAELGNASKGMGYLTLTSDGDGVFRRLPLLVRYEDAVYPSFALKAVCEFLKVPPSRIVIGRNSISLMGASYPGKSQPRDIKIPVNQTGSLRINFVGPWGRMKHYNFSDIYSVSQEHADWDLWQEEMKGKIVLISNTYTGSTDVGAIPVDHAYPLSGIHANVVHTILNQAFIKELRGSLIFILEFLLAALLFSSYLRHSAIKLSSVSLILGSIYLIGAAISLAFFDVFLPIAKPLLLIFFIWAGLVALKSVQNAFERLRIHKAKEMAERELEIGRKIQADFLPSTLPELKGWQIEAYFKPAYQVSGDFYDIFELSGGRWHAIVLGDVCDHGVGSALFMAVLRSMVRIFSLQSLNTRETDSPEELILETVQRTNNYIAENHGETGMFATMFIGFLNADSGEMFYVNCGHEPPPLIRNGQIKRFLKPSGLPIGAMEDSPYTCNKITFDKNDYIFLYTDGITDGLDGEGNSFSKKRLLECVTGNHTSLNNLLKRLEDAFFSHVSGGEVTDDVTFLALKREMG